MFIGRSRELALLEERFRSSKAELVVLYGRRRIGKSSLIRHLVEEDTNLFFEGLEGQKTPTQIEAAITSLREQWDEMFLNSYAYTYLKEEILAEPNRWCAFLHHLADSFEWCGYDERRDSEFCRGWP
jgi:AAA+ ATPase superfamily predicted ATPase